jgi:small subunit ribosomal protein S15
MPSGEGGIHPPLLYIKKTFRVLMARMHARTRGKSGSTPPLEKIHPEWSLKPREIESLITQLAEKGSSMTEIGMILRDQHAVPDIKAATGKKLSQILAEKQLNPVIPEDLGSLIKKTEKLKAHLSGNHKDLHNRRRLALIESKIRRLAKYYKKRKILSEDWKY